MARQVNIGEEEPFKAFRERLFRSVQSAHLNFLFGAGASCPGVPPAGNVEAEILALLDQKKDAEANQKTVAFVKLFAGPMAELISENYSAGVSSSLRQYAEFIQTIDAVLSERKTTLLPRQASIFTTNYDLFVEKASEQCPSVILNDGFNRVPSLSGEHPFRSEKLFDATLHTSNHYDYTAEIPSLNLVKLHGSMSWARRSSDVVYKLMDFGALEAIALDDPKIEEFVSTLPIVLPTQRKFRETILDRTYYDLLRIFANVLERENSLLVAFGFSFRDEHILEIVRRALRNPTLTLVITCYLASEVDALKVAFESYNNVTLLVPSTDGELSFDWLNRLLLEVTPRAGTKA